MHSAKKVTVGSSAAVKLTDFREGVQSKRVAVMLRPKDGVIYVGAEGVDAEHGFPVGANEVFMSDIDSDLWAIAATGSVVVHGFIQR